MAHKTGFIVYQSLSVRFKLRFMEQRITREKEFRLGDGKLNRDQTEKTVLFSKLSWIWNKFLDLWHLFGRQMDGIVSISLFYLTVNFIFQNFDANPVIWIEFMNEQKRVNNLNILACLKNPPFLNHPPWYNNSFPSNTEIPFKTQNYSACNSNK